MADKRLVEDLRIGTVEVLPEGALEEKLELAEHEGRPLRVKLGVDPTAPDIHLGHTVVLNKLRQFQDAGHVAVLIIGDYTARIGDPSGRSRIRPRLDPAIIDANAQTYQEQAFYILDDDPEKLDVRYNGEWLGDLTMEEVFGLMATTTVARILERDDFEQRFSSHQPISLLEMFYPLAQGYDSVAVRADIELGGTDQKFNLFMGRDLQEHFGQPPQAVMTLDILPGTDGLERMSKSTGNYIGVTEDPRDIYGKVMSIPDATMPTYFRLLTAHHAFELDEIERALRAGEVNPRDLKARLAREIITRVRGGEAAADAEEHFERVFRRHEVPVDLPTLQLLPEEVENGSVYLPRVMERWFGITRSDARRRIVQGGVSLDGETVVSLTLPAEVLRGRHIKAGKSAALQAFIGVG
ncbi:MAG TPA: tyrosine--tRNA ligase [Thermoleophilia bacterium]|nr:tyrosine--tRNA ligase [Thermoleophilia bacterium]